MLTITIKYRQSSITCYKMIEWQNKHHFQCSKFNFLSFDIKLDILKAKFGFTDPPIFSDPPPEKNMSPPPTRPYFFLVITDTHTCHNQLKSASFQFFSRLSNNRAKFGILFTLIIRNLINPLRQRKNYGLISQI